MTSPALDQKALAAALEGFTEYFVKNYPGPNTIIGDPNWHAPKIFRAAVYAINHALAALPAPEPVAWKTPYFENDRDGNLIPILVWGGNGHPDFQPLYTSPPSHQGLRADVEFLLDRLDDLERGWDDNEAYRQFAGHVAPAMARLRAALRSQPAPSGETK